MRTSFFFLENFIPSHSEPYYVNNHLIYEHSIAHELENTYILVLWKTAGSEFFEPHLFKLLFRKSKIQRINILIICTEFFIMNHVYKLITFLRRYTSYYFVIEPHMYSHSKLPVCLHRIIKQLTIEDTKILYFFVYIIRRNNKTSHSKSIYL
jgi:hypothetical protein